MKTDAYLNLCLDQAANSPLRYRHGCIIVRGGKVIGHGYNDYRTGFNGGALKTGQLPARNAGLSAVSELKKKRKLKREANSELEREANSASIETKTNTFTPFESMGGGKHANTPLSMHSEMMAIHSALVASSNLASSAVSSQKPSFKLSAGYKRKARLRREAVQVYVEASGDLKALHLNRAKLDVALALFKDKEKDEALDKENSTEKHREKNPKNHLHHKGYQYKGQHNEERRQHAHRLSAQGIVAPCHARKNTDDITSEQDAYSTFSSINTDQYSKSSGHTKYKQAKDMKAPPPQVKIQPTLLPKGHAAQSFRSISERKKHPRLIGADLYVARLGWRTPADNPIVCCSSTDTADLPSTSTPRALTGSLHDELNKPSPAADPTAGSRNLEKQKQPSVLASRPCYRCISYMHSVGIKRVFWTTDTGEWEGAKVRDLVDAMDDLARGDPSDPGSALSNIFVTKHEVLMLRRVMGDK